jgi:hypothetical protein
LGWDLISIDRRCPWDDASGLPLYMNDLVVLNGNIFKCNMSQGEFVLTNPEGVNFTPVANKSKITGNKSGDFYHNHTTFR